MSRMLEGGCACTAVRYRLEASPLIVHCCHCLNCQRQTGSSFVINVCIEDAHVQLLCGEPVPVEVPRDDGRMQRILRCPTCQVALWSYYTLPKMAFVRAGTLDVPSSVTPDVHIFTRSKLPWVTLPPSVPAFQEFYDVKTLWPEESLARVRALRG
ncbi:MAG TPA: GFA family protein [Candidatus Polarisedimenticolaceae bacterium]|nr:GFA family protein [Candidatus Polarisedimenticolaceae bacterium]